MLVQGWLQSRVWHAQINALGNNRVCDTKSNPDSLPELRPVQRLLFTYALPTLALIGYEEVTMSIQSVLSFRNSSFQIATS